MALFSRRPKKDADPAATEALPETEETAQAAAPTAPESFESVPEVPISVSTFGQPAPARPRTAPAPQAEQKASAEPGTAAPANMPDNPPLQAALAALPETPENLDILNVMRQAVQGPLYVRALGDAQELIQAGGQIQLAVATVGEQKFLLAFSGSEAVRASMAVDPGTATSVIGQPAVTVLRSILAGDYDGLVLDHAARRAPLVLPRALIEKVFENADPEFALKKLVCQPRTEQTVADIVQAVSTAPLWVAANAAGEGGAIGLAEARTPDGKRRLEVFTHPLEVVAMRRGDRPLPLKPEQLAKTLASDDALDGIVIDAAGPWIALDRAELLAVLPAA